MNEEQYEEIATLFIEIFNAASLLMEEHERKDFPDFLPDTILQDLREEYPAMALTAHPQKEMFLEILAGDHVRPGEDINDTIRFLQDIYTNLGSGREKKVLNNARLGLGVISNTMRKAASEAGLIPPGHPDFRPA